MVAAETVSCTVINTLPSFLETQYVSYLMYPSSSKNTSLLFFKFFMNSYLPSVSLLFFFWPISFSAHSFFIASCVFYRVVSCANDQGIWAPSRTYKGMCPTAVVPFSFHFFLMGRAVGGKALGFEFCFYIAVVYTLSLPWSPSACKASPELRCLDFGAGSVPQGTAQMSLLSSRSLWSLSVDAIAELSCSTPPTLSCCLTLMVPVIFRH